MSDAPPPTARTAGQIRGLEFDWLATDAHGHVGFFTTAGGGYAPPGILLDTTSHRVAIAEILAATPNTAARFAPTVRRGFANDWLMMAERGIFAYDSGMNGAPYRLVAAPADPISLEKLPDPIRQVASRLRCPFVFERSPIATAEDLASITG